MTTKAENAAITKAARGQAKARMTGGFGSSKAAPKPQAIKTRKPRADNVAVKTLRPAKVYGSEIEELRATKMRLQWAAERATRRSEKDPENIDLATAATTAWAVAVGAKFEYQSARGKTAK